MDVARLILEDGTVVEGAAFGARRRVFGELVFNTSMTGYQEALTDPSYAGQILMLTYPLIGNYGVNADDFESKRIWPRAFVVKEACETPSHFKGKKTIDEFLSEHDVPGIQGIDTRFLTVKTRAHGTLKAAIAQEGDDEESILARLRAMPHPDSENLVGQVTVPSARRYEAQGGAGEHGADAPGREIVLIDCGAKENIVRSLRVLGNVTRVPYDVSLREIERLDPDGVFCSNGPGDPAHPEILRTTVPLLRAVSNEYPVMGICLGHQLLALAFGAKTFKLKFGHRGANQPVRDVESGRVFVTSQNHGYAVDVASAATAGLEVSQVNANDQTAEGLRHAHLPVFSVQYHPEAHPGPRDTGHLFFEFERMMARRE